MDVIQAIEKAVDLLGYLADGKEVNQRAVAQLLVVTDQEMAVIVNTLDKKGVLQCEREKGTIRRLGENPLGQRMWGRQQDTLVLPKGLDIVTLENFIALIRKHPAGWESTAKEISLLVGVSIVTARLYLEYLVSVGMVYRRKQYRQVGRPSTRYGVIGKVDQQFKVERR